MKIDSVNGKLTSLNHSNNPKKLNKSGEDVGVNQASSNVQLSEQIQTLDAQSGNAEVFNAEKVAAIKSAIAEGRFTVNPDAVAQGLISSVKDLLGSK